MAHDPAVIDGDGGDAGSEIDQGDAVLLLLLAEDGFGDDVRQEVFLRDRDAEVVENLVDRGRGPPAADEDFETAFEGRAQGSDYVFLDELDLVVDGERLGDGAEHDLGVRIVQGVGLDGDGLEGLDLFAGDIIFRIVPFDPSVGDLLGDAVAGESDDDLHNLDHQFVLGLMDQFLKRIGGLFRDGYIAVSHPDGRDFPVVDDLHVVSLHFGDSEGELGGSQVDGGYVFLWYHGWCFYFLQIICLSYRTSTFR